MVEFLVLVAVLCKLYALRCLWRGFYPPDEDAPPPVVVKQVVVERTRRKRRGPHTIRST